MYAGMALRMSQDLGLQYVSVFSATRRPLPLTPRELPQEPTISSLADAREQNRARLLFWTVVALDRIICFGTGRPVTVSSERDSASP